MNKLLTTHYGYFLVLDTIYKGNPIVHPKSLILVTTIRSHMPKKFKGKCGTGDKIDVQSDL